MRILLISAGALPTPPPHYGGLEQVVSDLAGELVRRGHDVTVACTGDSRLPEGVKQLVTAPSARFEWTVERDGYQAYKDRLKEFDVVDDHSHCKYAYLSSPPLPIIGSVHDRLPFAAAPPDQPKPCFVARSRAHAEALKEDLARECLFVYNGVGSARYPYQEWKGERLLFLSRIDQWKGALEAVRAAKQMNVPLDVAGEDITVQDAGYVARVMRECDGRQIRYWGRVPHDLKLELLQNGRALLSPLQAPYFEVFGLHLVEALLCGTPVFARMNGAVEEILGNNSWIGHAVPKDEQIACCIDKLLILPECHRPEECRKRGLFFSVERMADEYLRLYERVKAGDRW